MSQIEKIDADKMTQIDELAKLNEKQLILEHQNQRLVAEKDEIEQSCREILINLETSEKAKIEVEDLLSTQKQINEDLQAKNDQKTSEFAVVKETLEGEIESFKQKLEENQKKLEVNIFQLLCLVCFKVRLNFVIAAFKNV